MTERRLVESFLAGDEKAFEVLYDSHTPALYQLALRLVGGGERDAEEVVQEAWMRAADGIAGFEARSSFRTWLMGIAVNCAREVLRRRPPPDPARRADRVERAVKPFQPESIDLERAIAALPEAFRLVLVLHDVEGFTHAEIAAQLDIEEGTSKSRLSRARMRVRTAIRPEEAR